MFNFSETSCKFAHQKVAQEIEFEEKKKNRKTLKEDVWKGFIFRNSLNSSYEHEKRLSWFRPLVTLECSNTNGTGTGSKIMKEKFWICSNVVHIILYTQTELDYKENKTGKGKS